VHCEILAPNRPVWIVHYAIITFNQPPDSSEFLLHSFDSQSPSLLVKIVQSLPVNAQVCSMSFLKFSLVLTNRFPTMHVTMSLDTVCIRMSLSSSGSMASKRTRSKDINKRATRATVERVSTSLSTYEDIMMIIDKDIKLKWKEVNDTFSGTFGEDREDRQVYVNIHKYGLYQIACRYPTFPCVDMI